MQIFWGKDEQMKSEGEIQKKWIKDLIMSQIRHFCA